MVPNLPFPTLLGFIDVRNLTRCFTMERYLFVVLPFYLAIVSVTTLNPPLPHQQSSGYFLGESEIQNLILIGSTPNRGIQQVRIHWLLDLIKVAHNQTERLDFNFDLLDDLIDRLYAAGLRPGFEIMGNPSDWFTNLEDKEQVYAWRDMVTKVATRYIDRYGLEYVSQWNFESWNEPDHKDFDNLNFTVQGFLNYYDACSEGLRAASPKLRLGGPAASCRDKTTFSVICWALLQHCDNGTNYFTGEKGVRLDFISIHHKGAGQSLYILDTELETIERIHTLHPRLIQVPIYNDEADPLVGWSKATTWRADTTYAAIIVKIIAQHQNLLLSQPSNDINYGLLGNDNGFMAYNPNFFTQRTLTARFQMNLTHPPSIQTVKKPVLSAMALLAFMEGVQVQVNAGGQDLGNDSDVGVLASVRLPAGALDSWQASFIVYNSNDTSNRTGIDDVTVTVKGVPTGGPDVVYVAYLLDNTHGNPHIIWLGYGKPVYPTRKQFAEIRQNQEPVRIEGPWPLEQPSTVFNFKLSKPGVTLFHICARSTQAPPQVKNVRLHLVTAQDILVSWDDVSTQCLLTYDVQYASTERGQYSRVNAVDLIFAAYLFSTDSMGITDGSTVPYGWYRVRAVDYWSRPGEPSDPVQFE